MKSLNGGLAIALIVLTAVPAAAQRPSNSRYANGQRMPLAPVPHSGEPVAPFFEGWYRNDDGTFTLSFGFFNLNQREILEIPLGPENFIEPAEFDGMQPTHFPVEPRRDRGVFHVTVPASFAEGEQRVVWTIIANGQTTWVPARVGYSALQLDYAPRAMGSVPPEVRFSPDGPVGRHIQGIWAEPRTATVGEPITLSLWVKEVSVRAEHDRLNTDVGVEVSWFKHQGPPVPVVFEQWQIEVESGEGEATTTATFTAPGEYLLRARVDNFDANDSSGGDQCCWTNAYVPVTVTAGS